VGHVDLYRCYPRDNFLFSITPRIDHSAINRRRCNQSIWAEREL